MYTVYSTCNCPQLSKKSAESLALREMENEAHNTTYLRFTISSFPLESSSPCNGFMPYNMKECMITHTTLKNGVYPLTFQTIYPNVSLVVSEAAAKVSLSALSISKKSDAISVYVWHQTMGHQSMKTIVDTENSVVTRTVLKDIHGDLPTMDSCLSCSLATAQHFLFKTGCMCMTMPLEPIHGDIVSPMPVESVSHCMYRFVLMDNYSHTSWVLGGKGKGILSPDVVFDGRAEL